MAGFLLIAGFLVFLILWGLAWRRQPTLAFGIFIGVAMGWVIALAVGPISLEHMPIWLPATPFAVVALTLFCLGVAVWFRGDNEAGETRVDQGH
jgi:hypothetical protein